MLRTIEATIPTRYTVVMGAEPSMEDFRGTDRFQVLRRLGAGACGVVYEVRDRELDTVVALKTLSAPSRRTCICSSRSSASWPTCTTRTW